jgi:hypothetical protein
VIKLEDGGAGVLHLRRTRIVLGAGGDEGRGTYVHRPDDAEKIHALRSAQERPKTYYMCIWFTVHF